MDIDPPFYQGTDGSELCDHVDAGDPNCCDREPAYEIRWAYDPSMASTACKRHGLVDRRDVASIRTSPWMMP